MLLSLLLLSRFSRVWLCATQEMAAHQTPRPWDSPGKNTGVGCHSLLQCMKWKVKGKSLSRVWLCVSPWTVAYKDPPSMGFSRKHTGVGCHRLLRIKKLVLFQIYMWSKKLFYHCKYQCFPLPSCPWYHNFIRKKALHHYMMQTFVST